MERIYSAAEIEAIPAVVYVASAMIAPGHVKHSGRGDLIVGDPPVVVGFEGVGEIEELGPGVTGFSVGERVCTCLPPLGAYSQERLYPADKLIKVPKDLPLDDVQLAGLILKGMTAQYLLHRTHKVQPGDYVLIHAAAGGMGHILCPWARHNENPWARQRPAPSYPGRSAARRPPMPRRRWLASRVFPSI